LAAILTLLGGLEAARVPLLALIVIAAFGISGIGAFVTGLISMIKSKEWSILVFLTLVVGLFALIALLDFVQFWLTGQ
jgi:hypothetical protein